MLVKSISNARTELHKLALCCIKNHEVVRINSSEGNVIVLSEYDYNNMIESIYLAGFPGMYDSIKEGVRIPIKECIKVRNNEN